MVRFSLSIGGVVVLVAGVTWLVLQRNPMAGPRPGVAGRPEAGMEDLLPYTNVISPEDLKNQYMELRVTPYNDPKFYFEITVPRNFESRPVQVTRQQLREDDQTPVPMVELAPRGVDDVLIEARYLRVPERVTRDRFMTVYVEKSGFQFVKRQRGEFQGRQVEDALLRMKSPKFGTTLTRLTVSRRGEFMFMVAGSCREEEYPKWKQAFAVAALSFNPVGK